jgi:hypothetical protein
VVEPAAEQDQSTRRASPAGRVGRLFRPLPADKPLADQQALYTGFGNALGQAVEIVGTGSILRVTLFVVALVGVMVSAYYRYQAAMDKAEEGKPWKR